MMNRIIKFRAWDKEKKRMIYFPILRAIDFGTFDKELLNIRTDSSVLFEDEFELLQFTGLKDKKGKEIYEGDIIRRYHRKDKKTYIQDEIYWDENECRFWGKNWGGLFTQDNIGYYEIIGNIYENPELLTKEN